MAGGTPYELQVVTNSTAISDFSFSEESRQISFRVEEPERTVGSTSLKVGRVLEGLYMVTLDGNMVEDGVIIISDETTSATIIAIQHPPYTACTGLQLQAPRSCRNFSCPAGRRAGGSDRPRCDYGEKNKVQPLNQDTFTIVSQKALA